MQFTRENAERVMAGTKTQTRRLVTAGDRHIREMDGAITHVTVVTEAGRRLKWKVGMSYAVCPGRGKPAIGRIRLLSIRREKLQDISDEDIFTELGALLIKPYSESSYWPILRQSFVSLWDSINPRGKRWADNPDVWALTFEVV